MPDIEFMQVGKRPNFGNVYIIDTVPRVNGETQSVAQLGSLEEFVKFMCPLNRIIGTGVGASVHLNYWGAQFRRHSYLPGIGINKQADKNTGVLEDANHMGNALPGLRRYLGRPP